MRYSFDANGRVLSKATKYNTLTLTWNELNQFKTGKLQVVYPKWRSRSSVKILDRQPHE